MMAIIRKARKEDVAEVYELMKGLAVFEKYINSFNITPEIVLEKGLDTDEPLFYCLVAEVDGKIAGMLVYYYLMYTAQNKPAIYMKELYVDEAYRGQSLGTKLMAALKEEAKAQGCTQIKWTVADWNEAGKKFYKGIGAEENTEWLNYEINL
ncbi:MAG: GNAT family N-acetyltransferase [Veillonella caviae]|nr:GNAT family N-acetyltransferase [Veillonella caviae]